MPEWVYFNRGSRKKDCFGGKIGGIDVFTCGLSVSFELAGFGGALGFGGGSSGP